MVHDCCSPMSRQQSERPAFKGLPGGVAPPRARNVHGGASARRVRGRTATRARRGPPTPAQGVSVRSSVRQCAVTEEPLHHDRASRDRKGCRGAITPAMLRRCPAPSGDKLPRKYFSRRAPHSFAREPSFRSSTPSTWHAVPNRSGIRPFVSRRRAWSPPPSPPGRGGFTPRPPGLWWHYSPSRRRQAVTPSRRRAAAAPLTSSGGIVLWTSWGGRPGRGGRRGGREQCGGG